MSQGGINVPHSGAGGGGLAGAGAFQRQAAGGQGEVPTAMSINSLAQHVSKAWLGVQSRLRKDGKNCPSTAEICPKMTFLNAPNLPEKKSNEVKVE